MTALALSDAGAWRSFAFRLPRSARPRGWMAVARLLAAACIAGALAASYPAIREEMAERGFLAEARRFGTPVIAVDCERSRGVENRDFTREDKNPDKCWRALTSFRRLYPESRDDRRARLRPLPRQRRPAGRVSDRAAAELLKAADLAITLYSGDARRAGRQRHCLASRHLDLTTLVSGAAAGTPVMYNVS